MTERMLTERELNIYSRLCDDESRLVFNARRHFALTKEKTHFADVFVNKEQLAELVEKLNGKKYVIYGGSFCAAMLINHFNRIGISEFCMGIWDNNPNLQGKSWGKHIITAPKYDQICSIDAFLISAMKSETAASIVGILASHGVSEEKIVTVKRFNAALGRCGYEGITQYLDEEIIVPRLEDGEVFIDAGCLDFTASSQLLNLASNVKRIYAFEPDYENMPFVLSGIDYNRAQSITKVYDCALWSSNEELGFWVSDFNKGASKLDAASSNVKVQGRKLDDLVLEDDKVSFIKMDIEGAELDALKGAAEIIKRDKPKLAISIYHKASDYIDLAEFICSLAPSYKLFMRHYSPSKHETVLYGVTD